MKTKTFVTSALLSSLFASLVACGGASDVGAPAPADPAAPSASSTAAPPPPAPTPAPADAGVADAAPAPIATHCPSSAATPSTCLENAEGHAGDVVNVEVHLVPSATCTIANEAYARFDVPSANFELANQADQVSCISRDTVPATSSANPEIWWQGFGLNAIPGCANPIGIGVIDTIQVHILPGTAPGDYTMQMDDAEFRSSVPGCLVLGGGGNFTIRVLP